MFIQNYQAFFLAIIFQSKSCKALYLTVSVLMLSESGWLVSMLVSMIDETRPGCHSSHKTPQFLHNSPPSPSVETSPTPHPVETVLLCGGKYKTAKLSVSLLASQCVTTTAVIICRSFCHLVATLFVSFQLKNFEISMKLSWKIDQLF